jgi:hypothetical protein
MFHVKSKQNKQNLAFAGQIRSLRWPHLAREPHGVQAPFKHKQLK